jgi:xylose dehydrogenase (NAD/NADP)
MNPVRIGIAGLGNIARKHIQSALRVPEVILQGVASRDLKGAQAVAREFAIPSAYGSYDDLFGDSTIDLVLLTVPNSEHVRWAKRALEAGKHVLCEKPLSASPEDVEELFDLSEQKGVLLEEALMYLHQPQHNWVQEQIRAGAISEVTMVRATLTYTLADWETDTRAKADLQGGALFDTGCYTAGIACRLYGSEPLRVTGMADFHPANAVDQTFAGILDFGEGRFAQISGGMRQALHNEYEILGSAGSIRVPNAFLAGELGVVIMRTAAGEFRREFPSRSPYDLQLIHVARRIREGLPPVTSREDSLANARCLRALAHSFHHTSANPL